jgi:hypothetical protein
MNLFSITVATSTAKGIEAVFIHDVEHFYQNGNLAIEGQRSDEKLYYLNVVFKIQQETSHGVVSHSHTV